MVQNKHQVLQRQLSLAGSWGTQARLQAGGAGGMEAFRSPEQQLTPCPGGRGPGPLPSGGRQGSEGRVGTGCTQSGFSEEGAALEASRQHLM